jgi:hypothetical protein
MHHVCAERRGRRKRPSFDRTTRKGTVAACVMRTRITKSSRDEAWARGVYEKGSGNDVRSRVARSVAAGGPVRLEVDDDGDRLLKPGEIHDDDERLEQVSCGDE